MSLQARYTILRKIADGGTAEIFLATQKGVHGFEKVVVLKRIFPAYYADPQFRDMLVNEAHIAMSFNHSNIVQVLDLGEDDGQYILALELVDGWTLDAVIRRVRAARSSFPPALALYVTAEVCRALAYAHAKSDAEGKPLGIVHRDISPHNVLLSEQGEVKLTDFGIATVKEKNAGGEKVIRGKIAFMSPEQAAGGPLDSRSDLFSVGTMLYVMICGRYPFDAPTDLEVLLLVKNGEPVPPEVARPGIHAEVARLLKRALAKDPAERFQRADDMLMEVEQVMRAAFRAVGQTELKRWLQDLSARDGVPSITKAPALPSSTPAGRVVGPGTPTGSSPMRIPPPPSGSRSGPAVRPPPPPAALSVGRRTGSIPLGTLPPRGRPQPPARPASDEDPSGEVPILDAPTPLPEPVSGPIPLVHDEASALQSSGLAFSGDTAPHASSPAQGAAETPPAADSEATAIPRSTAASLSARLSAGARPEPVPPPSFPQGPVVPPPPVAPEILAAVSGNDPRPAASAGKFSLGPADAAPPSAPAQRRMFVWAGAGLATLVILIAAIRACGGHPHADLAATKVTPPTAAPQASDNAGPGPDTTPKVDPAGAKIPAAPSGAPEAGVTAAVPAPAEAPAAPRTEPAQAAATPSADGGAGAGNQPTPPAVAAAPSAGAPTAPEAPAAAPGAPAQGTVAVDDAHTGTPATAPDAGQAGDAGAESKTKVTVSITTVPPGARLTTAHHDYGTTPTRIHFRAGNAYALTFKLDGYKPVTKHIDVTDEPEQEVVVTLRKSAASPAREAPATAGVPAPAPASPPPAPPKPGKSWWQKAFSR